LNIDKLFGRHDFDGGPTKRDAPTACWPRPYIKPISQSCVQQRRFLTETGKESRVEKSFISNYAESHTTVIVSIFDFNR